MSPSTKEEFSSEGFDLDAIPSGGVDDIVLEVGGGVTTVAADDTSSKDTKKDGKHAEAEDGPVQMSEEFKREGNELFKIGNYLEAYDMYTRAIEACPGIKGDEVLLLKQEFEEEETKKSMQQHQREEEERRAKQRKQQAQAAEDTRNGTNNNKQRNSNQNLASASTDDPMERPVRKPIPEFNLPHQEFGHKLAVYYCNRAACLLHQQKYDDAIKDADVAILLKPTYAKALMRRSNAYEQIEKIEDALRDAEAALTSDPRNVTIKKQVTRLNKLNDENMEKLKEQTMGQLKDLGNSLLGNFGLSLDNFKTVKDPNTGSYSVNFEQNQNK